MECVRRDAICIVTVQCSSDISFEWKKLLSEFARIYRIAGLDLRQRPFLVNLIGCSEYPPVRLTVGIRTRALWNVVRWEEVRLFTESRLSTSEHALVRAWRIAVYSASSNGDLDVILELCKEVPNSLSDAIECGLDASQCGSSSSETLEVPFVPDQRWNVPAAVVSSWATGMVTGSSLERGTNFNLKYVARSQARVYLHHAIWREQVSGLLPIVMEIGVLTNEAVRREIGDGWLADEPQGTNGLKGQIFLEPSEVIDRLTRFSSRRVSRILSDTLKLLRRTRNDIAHMRPVDYDRIVELSIRYDRVRRAAVSKRH